MRPRDSGVIDPAMERSFVTIGKIVSTHGVRGAVNVQSYSDVPGRFEHLEWTLVGGKVLLKVAHRQRTAKGYVVSFETIASPEEARSLVGSTLEIPEERLPAGSPDLYYECQLVGMKVQTEDGTSVGRLREVLPTPGNPVFVVEGPAGVEHLIPATKQIVRKVDVERQQMVVRHIPGLFEADHAV
jgi:16S rRNA processing protein RimM